MDKAQKLAARAVGEVLAGHNLTQAFSVLRAQTPTLDAATGAAMQELAYGTLRYLGLLQAVLSQLVLRPPQDARIMPLLLVALYQLQYGRAAPYTVVDHAVKAAASFKKPWAKGLVNAVLRQFLRRRDALLAAVSTDPAAQFSYPAWWIEKLRKDYPADWQQVLETGNQHPPMTLRVNRRRGDAMRYQARLADAGMAALCLDETAVMLDQPVHVHRLPGFNEGEVSVQDYGAQFAARLLDVADGQRVLDACCAPGGKTSHILELAEVRMVALDQDAGRLQRTQENLDRLGLAAEVRVGDAATPDAWCARDEVFDRILADVPCSASGIVRRHVDIKWLRRPQDVTVFAPQQAAILAGLWPRLANGGKLLYATCSVFIEENQRQIEQFLALHPEARQLPLAGWPSGGRPDGQLLPCPEHDGFFYALLQKME